MLVDGVEKERKMVTKDYTRRYKIRKTKLLQVLDCEKKRKWSVIKDKRRREKWQSNIKQEEMKKDKIDKIVAKLQSVSWRWAS